MVLTLPYYKEQQVSDKPVLLIDLLNLYCRCFSSIPLTNDDGEHVGGFYGSLNALQSYINKFSPSECIIAWEGAGSSQKRRKKLQDYKSGRKMVGMRRGFETSDETEKEAFARQLGALKEAMEFLPLKQVAVQYLEADDVIAYMCKNTIRDRKKIIVSTDRDYLQLVDENTSVFRPVKTKTNKQGQFIDLEWMHQKENIHPPNYALLKAVVGDKSDNIQGVKGIGEKTARNQIHLLWDNDKSYDAGDFIDWAKGRSEKKYQKYVENEKLIKLNYSVVQLQELEISMTAINAIDNSYKRDTPKFNSYKFRINLLNENVSPSNLDNWVASFSILKN